MSCPRLEDSTIFWLVENEPRLWAMLFRFGARQRTCEKTFKLLFFFGNRLNFEENLQIFERSPSFFGDRLNFAKSLRIFWAKTFFFGEHFRDVSLVHGLEHFCSWPQECLSSDGVSLSSDFFVSLALASSLVSSTPSLVVETNSFKTKTETETVKFFLEQNRNRFRVHLVRWTSS